MNKIKIEYRFSIINFKQLIVIFRVRRLTYSGSPLTYFNILI